MLGTKLALPKATSTLAAIVLVLTVSSCTSDNPGTSSQPWTPAPATSSALAPTPTPTASPNDPVAWSGKFDLKTPDGYEATVNYTWHEPTDVDYNEANSTPTAAVPTVYCADDAISYASNGSRSGTTNPVDFHFVRVRVTGDIEYKTVNGFAWPDTIPVRPYMWSGDKDIWNDQGSRWTLCGDQTIARPNDSDTSFSIEILYFAVKTPNDPTGSITLGPKLQFGIAVDEYVGKYVSDFKDAK
jgi:hypothetical protein